MSAPSCCSAWTCCRAPWPDPGLDPAGSGAATRSCASCGAAGSTTSWVTPRGCLPWALRPPGQLPAAEVGAQHWFPGTFGNCSQEPCLESQDHDTFLWPLDSLRSRLCRPMASTACSPPALHDAGRAGDVKPCGVLLTHQLDLHMAKARRCEQVTSSSGFGFR